MIINAIPANALQETIEADIRSLPYSGQWSAISVDEEDRVVVWNELDMTSAFYVFRLEPAWYKFQALAKPVFGPIRLEMGAQSVGRGKRCTLRWQSWPWGGSHHADSYNRFTGSLVSSPSPWEQGLNPSREVRRDGPFPRSGRPHDTSFYSVYLDGFSHAELKHWNQLSHPEKWS